MVAISATLVAVRLRRIGGFSAPDPWSGGKSQGWEINLYRMVSETFAAQLEWSVIKPRRPRRPDRGGDPGPGGRGLRWLEEIGIAPDGGARYRLLPRALQALWIGGDVPDTKLPGILAALEPDLRRRDFRFSRGRHFARFSVALLAVLDLAWLASITVASVSAPTMPPGFGAMNTVLRDTAATTTAVSLPIAILAALLAILAGTEWRVRRRDRDLAARIRGLAAGVQPAAAGIPGRGF